MNDTQLYCPRCGGEMEKTTYVDYNNYKYKNADHWYEKLLIILAAFNHNHDSFGDPGLLRCSHCNYFDDNIPSSFHKEGSVMVPPISKKAKIVNPIFAIVVVGILSLFIAYLLFLLYK